LFDVLVQLLVRALGQNSLLGIGKWVVLIVYIVTNISIAKETMMPFIPVVVIRLTIDVLQKRVSEKFVSKQMMHLSRLI
jgi:hypothetical protein